VSTHLASVTSEEQQRVQHLAAGNDHVWIGLTDSAEEGSFVWSDDEPLEYSNWVPGQPSSRSTKLRWQRSRTCWKP
jgi:hypothetical protein